MTKIHIQNKNLLQIHNKKQNKTAQFKKWENELNRHFFSPL